MGSGTRGFDDEASRPAGRVALRAGSSTSAGRVRTNNQDRFLIIDDRLFVVADGMGGHVGGEVAAQLAVDALSQLDPSDGPLRSDEVISHVEKANIAILSRAQNEPELRGMGTTVAGIAVVEGDDTAPALLLVINVGDSRTYWLRGGDLEQLSEDHSVVGELQREGKLSAVDARTHKSRSVLTRALGVEPDVECDVLEIVPIVGDRFLICSDGLPTELTDQTIATTLRQLRDPQEAAAALVREAVNHGGRDNVTVIVVDVLSGIDGNAVVAGKTEPRRREPTPAAGDGGPKASSARASAPTSPHMPRASRRPWIVNVRVVLFLACLGAIVAVVVWTVRNDPATTTEPPISIVVDTTLPPVITGTAIEGESATTDATPDTSDVGDAPPLDSSTVSDPGAIRDPVPGAVVDPFAPTTTTITTTSTTKKP